MAALVLKQDDFSNGTIVDGKIEALLAKVRTLKGKMNGFQFKVAHSTKSSGKS